MHVPVQRVLLDAPIVFVLMRAQEVLTGPFSLLAPSLTSAESVGLRNRLLRKVEELKNESDCSGIPDEFLCPITRELMRDPVIAAGKQRSAAFLSWCLFSSSNRIFLFFFFPPRGCLPTDGYSYEREAIQGWINTKNRSSPMTNLPLLTTLLTPNHTLKMAIGRWKTTRPT